MFSLGFQFRKRSAAKRLCLAANRLAILATCWASLPPHSINVLILGISELFRERIFLILDTDYAAMDSHYPRRCIYQQHGAPTSIGTFAMFRPSYDADICENYYREMQHICIYKSSNDKYIFKIVLDKCYRKMYKHHVGQPNSHIVRTLLHGPWEGNMRTFQRCTVCYRDVAATLAELHNHCDAYHYGQSPDLIFPHHGLQYKPLAKDVREAQVKHGEAKMGRGLLADGTQMPIEPTYVVAKPQLIIEESHMTHVHEFEPQEPLSVKCVYQSERWQELVAKGYITLGLEYTTEGEIALMEKF